LQPFGWAFAKKAEIRPICLIIAKRYVFYKQVPAERLSGLSGLNRFFDHEFDELNELFAFLAKAPSGWFPKSRQGSPNS